MNVFLEESGMTFFGLIAILLLFIVLVLIALKFANIF